MTRRVSPPLPAAVENAAVAVLKNVRPDYVLYTTAAYAESADAERVYAAVLRAQKSRPKDVVGDVHVVHHRLGIAMKGYVPLTLINVLHAEAEAAP